MTNLLHTGHFMPFKDQMWAGSDVAAYTRPRASEAAAAASSAELLSVSGLAEDSSYGAPAPADTTSELLLVENVLARGLDCPPFAVLAFMPILSAAYTTTHNPSATTLILDSGSSSIPSDIYLQPLPLPGRVAGCARLQRAPLLLLLLLPDTSDTTFVVLLLPSRFVRFELGHNL